MPILVYYKIIDIYRNNILNMIIISINNNIIIIVEHCDIMLYKIII